MHRYDIVIPLLSQYLPSNDVSYYQQSYIPLAERLLSWINFPLRFKTACLQSSNEQIIRWELKAICHHEEIITLPEWMCTKALEEKIIKCDNEALRFIDDSSQSKEILITLITSRGGILTNSAACVVRSTADAEISAFLQPQLQFQSAVFFKTSYFTFRFLRTCPFEHTKLWIPFSLWKIAPSSSFP